MSPALPLLQLVHLIMCLCKLTSSLAIFRELPQHQRVWQFTQADWQGLQAAIYLQDWSPLSTAPDVNSAWDFFHRNLISYAPIHRSSYSIILPLSSRHDTLNPVVRQLL